MRSMIFGVCALLMGVCGSSLLAQTAVLYTGSDWNIPSEAYQKVWASEAFGAKAGVTLAQVDCPELVTDEVRAQWKAQEKIHWDMEAYPAFAYFDEEGRCVLLKQRLSATGQMAEGQLTELIAEGKRRAEQVKTALTTGTVEALAPILKRAVEELGVRRSREAKGMKAAWDALKKVDPEDASGLEFGLTFDAADPACYKINDFVAKKEMDRAEAYLAELEAKPQTWMTTNQKQGLNLLRYLLKRDTSKALTVDEIAFLKAVVEMDPNTHFGIAAQGELCRRGEGPVSIPHGWLPKDVRAGTQTWKIDVGVGKVVRGEGRYALTVRREKGEGTMQILSLTAAGKTVNVGKTLAPWCAEDVIFEVPHAPSSIELKVAFDAPKEERGRLTLRELLPARQTVTGKTWTPPKKQPLALQMLLRKISPSTIKTICKQKGGDTFLTQFTKDKVWMEDFLASGTPLANWDVSLMALEEIVSHGGVKSAADKRWATAAALNAGADMTDVVRLYHALMGARRAKQMVKGADDLRVDLMRYIVLPAQVPAESVAYLTEKHCVPPRMYDGVCWHASYRTYNFFGDSVQGSSYYTSWDHAYVRHENSREVGAVCGGLSYYGSAAAKAHGVPSTPAGQPAHCAYSLWSEREKRWRFAYYINPYSGAHFRIWGDRYYAYSYQELAADAFGSEGFRKSMRTLWQIELAQAKKYPQPKRSPMTCEAYAWNGRKLPVEGEALEHLGTWEDVESFDINQAKRPERVFLKWKGVYKVTQPTVLKVSISSDDGASFILNGTPLVGKDGVHGMEGGTTSVTLEKGEHPFELRYFNMDGGRGLELSLRPPVSYDENVAKAYAIAAKECPANLYIWNAYADWLRNCEKVPLQAWRTYGNCLAELLKDHVEPAWQTLYSTVIPELRRLGKDKAVAEALIAWSKVIRQGPQPTAEFANYEGLLREQAKLLGKNQDALFQCFEAALKAQLGTPNAFGQLLKWGGEQFLSDEKMATRYVSALNTILAASGDGGDALAQYVRNAMRAASNAESMNAYHALCDLQDRLSPATRNAMTFEGINAPLLSDKGLLKISTPSSWDHANVYRHVTDGLDANGSNFHTNREKNPWTEVVLPGMAEVSAIYVQNTPGNQERLVPFVIEVSADGKAWTQVASSETAKWSYTFTFAPVKGKYVRLTCKPKNPDDTTFLHLQKFCVFGKKLY